MSRTLIALVLCGSATAVAAAGQGVSAPNAVTDAVNHCVELKFPNSMARPQGFDINAHLAEVQKQYRGLIGKLSNPDGLRAVEAYLASEHNDVEVLCAIEITGETGRKEAVPILRKYLTSPIHGVSEKARSYLMGWKGNDTI